MGKITKIIFTDNIKDKVVVIYLILLALLSWTSLLLQDNASKGALTELNIILFITPLMSLLYTVTYLYDSHDFIVLLLSQPLKRNCTDFNCDGLCNHANIRVIGLFNNNAHKRKNTGYRHIHSHLVAADNDL